MIWNTLTKRFTLLAAMFCASATPVLAADGPANKPATEASTFAEIAHGGSDVAQPVRLVGTVRRPEANHEYRLQAQLRLHGKKGENGPLLNIAANSKVVNLGQLKPTDPSGIQTSLDCDVKLDITLKDLQAFGNLPANSTTAIRVEPQVYDVTADKYLTQPKTDAVILLIDVRDGGKVFRIQSFSHWFPEAVTNIKTQDAALALVASLDAWELGDYDLAQGFEAALKLEGAPQANVIQLIPAVVLNGKNDLAGTLKKMTTSPNEALRVAAEKKLNEPR